MYIKFVVILVAVYLVGAVLSDCGTCGENEECKQCGSPCEKTCDEPNPVCITMCTEPKCECVGGYVRNAEGTCIPQNDCPAKSKKCGVNEKYVECASACTPTCKNPSLICTKQCASPRCQCVQGHVRNDENVCIPQDECPAN